MMRLPKFEYHTPQTIAEAVRIMGEAGPVGQFVAGGTDLYPNMKRRQQVPKTVISVMRLAELNQITGDGARGLRIGASTRSSTAIIPLSLKPRAPFPRRY
jgi:CO/xanthine dehydrogenase FAD-binding subunit